MEAKYLKGRSLFDVDANKPSSSLWKAIVQKREILKVVNVLGMVDLHPFGSMIGFLGATTAHRLSKMPQKG